MILQSSIDTARINLFARLIKRGAKRITDVPETDRKAVEEAIENLTIAPREGEFEEEAAES